MKFLVRFSVLLLILSSLTFAGCILGDDDDDDYVASTGEILLSADVDAPAGTTFAAALRGAVAGDLRAARSSKFKAVIRIGGSKVADKELDRSDDGKKLTLAETSVTANTGKQQVTIEVTTITDEKPILKTILTADVSASTPVEKKNTAVNTTTTAQAIAYEASADKSSKTIEEYVTNADTGTIEAYKKNIEDSLGSSIDGTKDLTTIAPPTAEDSVKAVFSLFLQALSSASQGVTTDSTKASQIVDTGIMFDGMDKTAVTKLLTTAPQGFFDAKITSFSGENTLSKIDDSTYVVTFKGTISGTDGAGNSYTKSVDGSKHAYSLTGAANQADFAMTGTVKHSWSSLIVKKGTDGAWRIFGNRAKVGAFVELVIANTWINGSTGQGLNADLWVSSQNVVSAVFSGGILNSTGTINLSAEPENSEHWGWAAGPNYSWIQAPNNTSIAAGQIYKFTVVFADGTQTFSFTVPALPGSYPAPTVTPTSPAAGQLNVTWTAEPSSSFHEYFVMINALESQGGNMGDEIYSASILSAGQNQIQRTGLTAGQWVRIEVNVKTQDGFCKRRNIDQQISN